MNASRWCAGCHDPVPFFSGKFDDPNFDIVKDPTAHAGITCVVCHSITHVNGPIGNAAFTIEEAQHYPFAFSENPSLQWINNQLIKAKPELHKKTFLKPFHKSAEFCSTCHKVRLPVELNHYKDFLRGQNHYDTFILSGAGNGVAQLLLPAEGEERELRVVPHAARTERRLRREGFRRRPAFASVTPTSSRPRIRACSSCSSTRIATRIARRNSRRSIDKTIAFLRGTGAGRKDKKLRIDLFGVEAATTCHVRGEVPSGAFDDNA